MVEKLSLDTGVLDLVFQNGQHLRFNPTDMNLYKRFLDLVKQLPEIEQRYREVEKRQTKDDSAFVGAVLDEAVKIDAEVKGRLDAAFGGNNNFDALLDGVNIMAWGKNGERIITNLLAVLKPYIDSGVKQYAKEAAADAVAVARQNREQRGSQK